MKTKLFSLAFLLVSFTISYGHGPVKIQKTANPAIFNLTYVGDENAKEVKVKITDEQGNLLADRTVKSTKQFSLPLNFTSQHYGKYFVTVNTGTQSETQELAYGTASQIIPQPAQATNVVAYTSRLKSGQYLVSVPQDQITTARITVLDADQNIIFTTTKEASNGAALLLNTKNIQGPTSIEVTDASAE